MKTRLLIILTLIVASVHAQNLQKVNVSKVSLRNSGEVIQGGLVKGYYYFYALEKVDNQHINYLLSVIDENLHEINSVNILRPKNYVLVESAYNGSAFAFMFYDPKQKKIEVISYDATLKQIGQYTEPVVGSYANFSFQQIARGVDPEQEFLVPVTNEGFIFYSFVYNNKAPFQIKYYDNALKQMWSTPGAAGNWDYQSASDAFQSSSFIGSIVTRRKGRNIQYSILLQDRITGKQIFEKPLETKAYSLSPSDVHYDSLNNDIVVFGEFYDTKDHELSDKSKGFGSFIIKPDGNIEGERLMSWADLSSKAPVDSKGTMDGSNTNIYFHDFIRTDDGKVFGIGEQYKKVANGGAIAAKILLGPNVGVATSKINVYSMVIFQFGSDYNVEKVYFFEKSKTSIPLPNGSTYLSAKRLSYYVKARGGFDFSFDTQSADKSTFTVTYIDFDRSEGGKRVVGSIAYTPEKTFARDKMVLNQKSTAYRILRAKPGYFMVIEYYRPDKKLSMRLEKVNF